jgi:hypothetical protein
VSAIRSPVERREAFVAIGKLLADDAAVRRALGLWDRVRTRLDRQAFLTGIITRWVELDAHAATDWVVNGCGDLPGVEHVKAHVLLAAVRRWAAGDPLATASWLAQLPAKERHMSLVYALVQEWARTDPTAAIAWLKMSGIDERRKVLYLRTVLTTWGRTEPEQVLTYLDGLPAGDPLQWMRRNALASLAERNPHRALSLAEQLENPRLRQTAIRQVLAAWARSDPEATLAYLDGVPADDPVQSIRTTLIVALARTDPQRAILLAERLAGEQERWNTLKGTIALWGRTAPHAALGYLDGLPADDPLQSVRSEIIVSLAGKNIREAVKLAEALEEGVLKARTFQSVARTWARSDPGAAAGWLFERGMGHSRSTETLGGILRDWQWRDDRSREACVKWIRDRGMDHPVDVLKMMVERLARADLTTAYDWVKQLPDDDKGNEVRASAYEMIIREVARSDGAKAANMVEASTVRLTPVVVAEVVYNWAAQDPEAAAAWVETFPEGTPERQQAITDVWVQWARTNRVAADAWEKTMRAGSTTRAPDGVIVVE